MSTFLARDRGLEYVRDGVVFLQQNAVEVTAHGPLGASTRCKQSLSLLQAKHGDQDHEVYSLTAAQQVRGMKVMTTERGIHSATAATAEDAPALNAYYLPWDTNKSFSMTLGGDADFCFTAPMNGCAFFITGARTTPTIYHSNYYLDPEVHALQDAVRYQRRAAFYARLRRMLGGAGVAALLPEFYLSANGVKSTATSVFGFRDRNSGEWNFSYHVIFGGGQPYANKNAQVVVQYRNKPYFMTGPLWPVMHQPTWRSWVGHYVLG